MQSLCRAKKILMTSNVLPLHFSASQASSSQNSNVDSYLQHCEVDSLKCSKSQLSLFLEGFSYLNHCGAVDTIAAAATAGGIIFSRGKLHAARFCLPPKLYPPSTYYKHLKKIIKKAIWADKNGLVSDRLACKYIK